MGRFLIYFSYIGTRYSGLQIQKHLVKGKHQVTVQGVLQDALKRLNPRNDFRIVLSSRTDKGVHSLKNACHVNLDYPEEGKDYNPDIITNVMNYQLEKDLHDVRVIETRRVNSSFHARLSAQERKYVYRLAHVVEGTKSEEERDSMTRELKKFFIPRHKYNKIPLREPLSVTDACKVKAIGQTLDISKLISAADVCSGIHDYSSFTRTIKHDNDYRPSPVKLLTIGVKRGQPFAHSLNAIGQSSNSHLEFWDIHVRSRSFLYRQVRRVVGGMVLVASNKISIDDLKDILDNPRVNYPFSSIMAMNESGLLLVDVGYNQEDLNFEESPLESPSKDPSSFNATHVNFDMDSECKEDELNNGDEQKATISVKEDFGDKDGACDYVGVNSVRIAEKREEQVFTER